MNKKGGYIFRIVLGGYLAWLGIRMLIEVTKERPNNMIFMGVMSVIFILIGSSYGIYYLKKLFDLKKESSGIEEEKEEAETPVKELTERKALETISLKKEQNEKEKTETAPDAAAESKQQPKETEKPDERENAQEIRFEEKTDGDSQKSEDETDKDGVEKSDVQDKHKAEDRADSDALKEEKHRKDTEEQEKSLVIQIESEKNVIENEIENDYEER